MGLVKPIFVNTDPAQIVSESIAFYEAQTGKILQPAQPERLLINDWAYREALLRNAINETGAQNLIDFATAPVLDYLAAFFGVTRLDAAPSTTTIEFTFTGGHGNGVIPVGIRVGSTDGNAIFVTTTPTNVLSTDTVLDVICECVNPGKAANGYAAATISVILDPLPILASAQNINTSGGGADPETDDQLRARTKLAPSSFSVAGPTGAYKYWALTADPTIIDVSVGENVPAPGSVTLYPLVLGGISTPSGVLAAVLGICSDETIRPCCDTVYAVSPTPVSYALQFDITLFTGANQTLVVQALTDLANAYAADKITKLGLDIIRAKLIALCADPGIYDVNLVYPAADIVIADNQFGVCSGVVINVVGFNNG